LRKRGSSCKPRQSEEENEGTGAGAAAHNGGGSGVVVLSKTMGMSTRQESIDV
jgi:hypothetical protein